MARIMEMIRAKREGNYRYPQEFTQSELLQNITKIDSQFQKIAEWQRYKLEVTLGVYHMIDSEAPNAIPEAIKNAEQQIQEAIFGEFRERLILILMAADNRDYREVRIHTQKLYDSMFDR